MRKLVDAIEEWGRAEMRRTRRSHVPQMDEFPEELSGLHSSLNGALAHIDRELQSTIASGEQTMSVLSGMSEGVLAVDDQQRICSSILRGEICWGSLLLIASVGFSWSSFANPR